MQKWLIEMEFGMLSPVDLGNVLHGALDAPTERSTFGVYGQLKSIVKHRIWVFGKRVRYAKNGLTNLNDLYIA